MTAWGIFLIVLALAFGILLIAYHKNPFVKLAWKYIVIIIPVLLLIAVAMFSKRKTVQPPGRKDDFSTAIDEAKEKINEANMTASIQVTAARTENKDKLDQLQKVTQIEDDAERRKQLAALMG